MDFLSLAYSILDLYKQTRFITSLFVDRTAALLDSLGEIELNTAKQCLIEAHNSGNPEKEIDRAITILRMSFDKLKDCNVVKFQLALLIAICYYALNEETLCNLYKNKSVTQFRTWINHRAPIGMIAPVTGMSVSINYPRYEFFRNEIENLGLKWKGHGSFVALNALLMNVEISKVCNNAICDFEEYVEQLFSSNDVLDYNTLMSKLDK